MPTYEYKCAACGHRFDRFQSITAAPLKQCPACGKNKAQRLIGTGAGIIFKGSGFYITDYRSDSYKEKAKAESGSGDSKPSGDSGKSDAKADAATPAKAEAAPAPKPEPKPAKSESKPPKKRH